MDDVLKFTYEPLAHPDAQTRVLVIFPDPPEAPLRMGIETMDLGAKRTINYDALSYAWGDQRQDAEVEVRLRFDPKTPHHIQRENDVQDTLPSDPVTVMENYFPVRRKLCISSNLEKALRHLRQPNEGWCAWADGICINQADDDEKSHQVRRMDLVYKGAKYVSVWLGDSTDQSELAADLLDEYSKFSRNDGACRHRNIDHEQFIEKTRSWMAHWDALCNLLQQPWFGRRWIIQEAVLARDLVILCGNRAIPWCNLPRVSEILLRESNSGHLAPISQKTHATVHLVSAIHDIRGVIERDTESSELNLEHICTKFFSSSCYDPRDIVYSLLSLLKDDIRQVIFPDYSKNTTVEDVFVQCFKVIVDSAGSLDFMFRAKHYPSADLNGAESWLPCLGAGARTSCRCGTFGGNEGIYHSLPDKRSRASLSTAPDYCIEKIGGTFTLIASGHLYCPIFYTGNGSVKLDDDNDFAEFRKTTDVEKEVERFNESMRDKSPRVAQLPLKATEWSAFSNDMAQKGDIVCVLLGCSSPVVLRSFTPGFSEYSFVCPIQVNGIMEGEFMDLCIKKNIPPQRFRIR